ncbi:MAG TPA: hypothetical protein VHY30_04325 [Verrucomicrobiae bacterium]|jgi:hypothetical protein|nr:hypothetical protein [Verrucomicrobiae bacterium]
MDIWAMAERVNFELVAFQKAPMPNDFTVGSDQIIQLNQSFLHFLFSRVVPFTAILRIAGGS